MQTSRNVRARRARQTAGPGHPASDGGSVAVLPFGARGDYDPLPEPLVEHLAGLWCEVFLESLRQRPVTSEMKAA